MSEGGADRDGSVLVAERRKLRTARGCVLAVLFLWTAIAVAIAYFFWMRPDEVEGGRLASWPVPAAFVAIGVGAIVFVLRAGRDRGAADARMAGLPKTAAEAGPARLKATASPLGKLLGTLALAVFWNGIVSVFVRDAWQGWQRDNPDWFLTLFLLPFVLVGLAFVVLAMYFLLGLANPRSVVTVSRRAVPLGGSLELEWKMSGRVERLERLAIHLVGEEEARYRRGTNTYTDSEVFAKIPVLDTRQRHEIRRGACRVEIPADTMHTFEAPNNKIRWALRLQGEIPRWPDVDDAYPIVLLPMETSQ